MEVRANGRPGPGGEKVTVTLAAAGDVHCSESNAEAISAAFAEIAGSVDLILLAGDLTTYGEPVQAEVLAAACRPLETPVVAVLGNHDLHAGCRDELVEILAGGGVTVLDRSHASWCVRDVEVGIVG